MSTTSNDQDLQALAKKRVDQKMGFLTHLIVYLAVNGGLYLLGEMGGNPRVHFFPVWGWSLGLFIHGIVTLVSLQGPSLRDRLMDDELKTLRARQGR